MDGFLDIRICSIYMMMRIANKVFVYLVLAAKRDQLAFEPDHIWSGLYLSMTHSDDEPSPFSHLLLKYYIKQMLGENVLRRLIPLMRSLLYLCAALFFFIVSKYYTDSDRH